MICPTCGHAADRPPRRRDVYVEEAEQLLPSMSPEAVAARLGVSCAALARTLYRAQRPDLARPFERVRQARRRAA